MEARTSKLFASRAPCVCDGVSVGETVPESVYVSVGVAEGVLEGVTGPLMPES